MKPNNVQDAANVKLMESLLAVFVCIVICAPVIGFGLGWGPITQAVISRIHPTPSSDTKNQLARRNGAICAGIFLALAIAYLFAMSWIFAYVAVFVFTAFGLALATIDQMIRKLPNKLVGALATCVGVLIVIESARTGAINIALTALTGAVVSGAIFFIPASIGRGLVGMGDVKFATVAGMLLGCFGPQIWVFGMFSTASVAGVMAVPIIRRQMSERSRSETTPKTQARLALGPAILAGPLISVVFGNFIALYAGALF